MLPSAEDTQGELDSCWLDRSLTAFAFNPLLLPIFIFVVLNHTFRKLSRLSLRQ